MYFHSVFINLCRLLTYISPFIVPKLCNWPNTFHSHFIFHGPKTFHWPMAVHGRNTIHSPLTFIDPWSFLDLSPLIDPWHFTDLCLSFNLGCSLPYHISLTITFPSSLLRNLYPTICDPLAQWNVCILCKLYYCKWMQFPFTRHANNTRKREYVCYRCGQRDHFIRDCPTIGVSGLSS